MTKSHYGIFLLFLFSITTICTLAQPAKPGEIILYEDVNYKGKSGSHSFGQNETSYEIPNSNRLKISNDAMSSLKVGKGVKLTLFSDAGFRGSRLVFCEGEYSSLPCDWSDALTSFRMEKIDPKNYPVVRLYSHYGEKDWQTGRANSVSVGEWDDEICNDEISAINVPAGIEVTIYEHGGYKGREYTFSKSGIYRLSEYDMNDKVSSIRVRRSKYVLKKVEFKNRKELSSNDKIVESESTDENLSSQTIISRVRIEKSFANTISETKSTSNTTGVEIGVKVAGEVTSGVSKASVETSLVAKYEHNWTEGTTKEESETTTFSKEIEVPVAPGKIGIVNLYANAVTVEYDVETTYSPVSGKGADIVEKSKVRMTYSQKFRTVVTDKPAVNKPAVSPTKTPPAVSNPPGKVITNVTCFGKKFVLLENGDIYLQAGNKWDKIGFGGKKLECYQNLLVATIANGTRLKWSGTPNLWHPL